MNVIEHVNNDFSIQYYACAFFWGGYSHHLAAMVAFYCLSAVASNCCTCAVDHPKSLCVLSKFTNIQVLVGFTPVFVGQFNGVLAQPVADDSRYREQISNHLHK